MSFNKSLLWACALASTILLCVYVDRRRQVSGASEGEPRPSASSDNRPVEHASDGPQREEGGAVSATASPSPVPSGIATSPESVIRAAAERDRSVKIPASTIDEPPQKVGWDQFLYTGMVLEPNGVPVEFRALVGLKSYSLDYAEALAENGYYEVTERTHPGLVRELRSQESQLKLRALQRALADNEGKNVPPVIAITRMPPEQANQ